MILDPVHWSALKHVGRSPAHYRYYLRAGCDETAAMRVGTAVHALVLGPSPRGIVTFDGATRRGKAWDEFAAEHAGETILTRGELARADAIAAAVRDCPAAMRALDGEHEVSLDWQIAGRACAGRIDSVSAAVLCDLKTTRDASPGRFRWSALRDGYLGQLAWYWHGLEATGRRAPGRCAIVAVESSPPYPVVVYELSDDAFEAGTRQWRELFERLRVCEDSDEWPGYATEPVELAVPAEADEDAAPVDLDFGEAST